MTKNKEITPRVIWNALLAVFALGLLAIALFGCNPVARVISNPKHYKAITEHVISSGACVNDTLVISKSDTVITYDTLFAIDYETDTFTVDREIVRTKVVTKTVKIRDTVTQVVTDRAKENLLQIKLIDKTGEVVKKTEELEQAKAETKAFKQARNKWRLYFWLLVAAITAFLLRKPILKLISPIKL